MLNLFTLSFEFEYNNQVQNTILGGGFQHFLWKYVIDRVFYGMKMNLFYEIWSKLLFVIRDMVIQLYRERVENAWYVVDTFTHILIS